MTRIEKELNTALEYINKILVNKPEIAIILGSGLGGFAECIEDKEIIE